MTLQRSNQTSCEIDPSATGGNFREIKVLKDVPGAVGLSSTRQTSFDMKLQMPDDIECVGGSTGRVCVVRCRNAAFAGRMCNESQVLSNVTLMN